MSNKHNSDNTSTGKIRLIYSSRNIIYNGSYRKLSMEQPSLFMFVPFLP